MPFTIQGMTLTLAVPHLHAEAALEIIADEDGAQINVMDRNGMIEQLIRIEFNDKGDLELNIWTNGQNPHEDRAWVGGTLLFAEDTREENAHEVE